MCVCVCACVCVCVCMCVCVCVHVCVYINPKHASTTQLTPVLTLYGNKSLLFHLLLIILLAGISFVSRFVN